MEIEATGRFSAADLEPTRVAVHWTGQIGTGAVRDQVLRLQPCLMSDVQSSKSGFSLGIKMTAAMIALIAMVSAGIYFSLLSHEKQSLVAAKENAGRMVFHLFGENTSSALLFADEEGISKGLQQLGENPEVLYAAVWAIDDPDTGAKGKLMGEFRRPDFSGKFETPAVVREAIVTTGSETLAINDAVTQRQGGRIGQALVVFSLQRELAALENAKSGIMLVAAAVASLLSILLFIAVRLIVVSPLKRVVGAADGLRHGNRQLLELNSKDEVGDLAHAFNKMADTIEERETRVVARNRDMRLVLDNVDQGFVTIYLDGKMSEQRSACVERWFGVPHADTPVWHYIAVQDSAAGKQFEAAWEALKQQVLPFSLAQKQLPHQLLVGKETYRVEYSPVMDGSELISLVMVITNITAEVASRLAEAEQREMIGVFERIMRDKPAFFEFLEESSRVILEIESATLDIDELREHLRWLEVSCGLFGMQSMCTMVSAMRKTLVADGRKELSAENVAQLARKWAATRERIDGFVSGQSTDDPVIELPVAEYTALLAKVRSGGDVAELARSLEAWQDEPVLRWLERCAYQATAVAHRYHKVSLDVAVEGNGVRIDSTTYEPIWEALAHNIPRWVELALLPAASGEEKNEKAKERTAAVRLETIPEGRGFLIRIEVSGSGVDWPKLIHGVDEAQAFKSQIPQISALVQANGISALRELGNLRELAELELACVALGGELSVSCDEPDGPAFLGLRFVAAANTRPVGQAVAI